MKLVLETSPQFLGENFAYLEDFLLGRGRTDVEWTRKVGSRPLRLLSQPIIVSKQDRVEDSLLAKEKPANDVKGNIDRTGFGRRLVQGLANFVLLGAVIVTLVMFGPKIYYNFFASQTVRQNSALTDQDLDHQDQVATESGQIATDSAQVKKVYVPAKNSDLPKGDWLVIPRIGVRSKLQPTEEPDAALASGIWWAPDFGKPGEMDKPMIVAAHRYGWQWWWKTDYWRYHSFYNLPQTESGDIVEVISDQRKWLYEIYAGEEGTEISDYEADLILYTCKFLNSPVRYFRYANLVVPDEKQVE